MSKVMAGKVPVSLSEHEFDYVVGHDDRIYFSDPNLNLIHVFTGQGEPINTITIEPIERLGEMEAYQLGIDALDNLYVNVTWGEIEITTYIFDKNGVLVRKHLFNEEKPRHNDRVIGFHVTGSGRIYLETFPAEIYRPNWPNRVYVFDRNFNFEGMTDYCMEDNQGYVYKREDYTGSAIIMGKYLLNDVHPMVSSGKLKKVGTIQVGVRPLSPFYKPGSTWLIAGIDDQNNVYTTNGIVTRKFNTKLEQVAEYSIPIDDIGSSQNIGIDIRRLKIAPKGTVFLGGMKMPIDRTAIPNESQEIMILKADTQN
jgi:hypothetical protein